MTQATAPSHDKEIADSPLRYLMRADDEERKKWGKRAVELGFPTQDLRTRNHAVDLLKWLPLVRDEMKEAGLWKPPEPKAEPEIGKQTAKVIQLPLWPEAVRAVPNDILRSALFASIQGSRRYIKNEVIAAVDGVTIIFKGEQLDQSDLDVWEQATHLARSQPLGHICHFRVNAFLKDIGRDNGKAQYKWLDESIKRLIACAVEIRNGSRVFTGSLLSSCCRDEETGVYQLTLDQKTMKLYSPNNWSSVEWAQRQAMIGKPLALWLHGFYSSHATPLPYKVETLRKLCGSDNKTLKSFRGKLRKALDDLKASAAIVAWAIDSQTDLVTVDRGAALTDSQRRHLAKPPRRRKPPV